MPMNLQEPRRQSCRILLVEHNPFGLPGRDPISPPALPIHGDPLPAASNPTQSTRKLSFRMDVAHQRLDGALHAIRDLVAQRAAGDGERDEDLGATVVGDVHRAQHADVDDGAVEFWIFDRTQGFDDLLACDGHGWGLPTSEFALRR